MVTISGGFVCPNSVFLGDPPDPARAAEGVARSVCLALMPHLAQLKGEGLTPLAVRVCLEPDNVSINNQFLFLLSDSLSLEKCLVGFFDTDISLVGPLINSLICLCL